MEGVPVEGDSLSPLHPRVPPSAMQALGDAGDHLQEKAKCHPTMCGGHPRADQGQHRCCAPHHWCSWGLEPVPQLDPSDFSQAASAPQGWFHPSTLLAGWSQGELAKFSPSL